MVGYCMNRRLNSEALVYFSSLKLLYLTKSEQAYRHSVKTNVRHKNGNFINQRNLNQRHVFLLKFENTSGSPFNQVDKSEKLLLTQYAHLQTTEQQHLLQQKYLHQFSVYKYFLYAYTNLLSFLFLPILIPFFTYLEIFKSLQFK